ncbi:MAG: tetratricopeptide repeat protein [Isosphaeraceae bacterium]|nr:tetratricopeptide repeat protein [Isosphaeraceae bacterium]
MQPIRRRGGICSALALIAVWTSAAGAGEIEDARVLRQTGKYAESREAYEKILAKTDLAAADRATAELGLADALAAVGETEVAEKRLDAAVAAAPKDPRLLARRAAARFARGDWKGADVDVAAALAFDADHLAARWVAARLAEARGKVDPKGELWKWFIDYQNRNQAALAKDAEGLLIVGQAAERYYRLQARGEQLSEALNDVINETYETALKIDPNCWEGAWLQGRLFLSGYQEGDARRELTRALEINPLAAEVIVTLGQSDLQGYKLAAGRKKAERAVEINPKLVSGYVLLSDLNISDERFTEARDAARKAVAINPRDEDALARLAASARLLVDPAGALAAETVALTQNPKPATFYAALAERLADRRKYHSAERAFLLSIDADPERADAKIGLGMLYMQIGREPEARELFDAAFDADPFNVRAKNMIKILEHMATYRPVTSEHYSVLVDPKQDMLLGKYIADYLESIHGELTKRFGYEPPATTQIQIMKDHEKFSGRTVALPFIPTVGACTGKVVALASPKTSRSPFNWARVMKHELVHVITLQQTDFNIPHWFTEALAVDSEGYPRPQPWNRMLLTRVPARRLLNLDDINLGFIRPSEPEDRQLAYCQSQLYARYMLERFGDDALEKMLAAYRRGLTTDKAIQSAFGVDKADFEKKYLDYLDNVVKTIRTRTSEEPQVSFSKLERELAQKPDDPDLNARMAYEHFARRDYKAARPFADKALGVKKGHPLASYVKARLLVTIGDDDAALAVLAPALDEKAPNERVIDLLAELRMKAGELDEAERLYEIARKDDPYHSKWISSLARVHLRQKDEDKLLVDLERLADNDADDLAVRKTLADRFLAKGDAEKAEKWALECLYIEVYDPTLHVLLADARAARKAYAGAIEEYEIALTLKPKGVDAIRVKLAKAKAGAGDRDAAIAILDSILAVDPDHPEAKAARAEIGR